MAPGFLPSLESLLQSQTNQAYLSRESHMESPGQAGPRTPAPQVPEDWKAGSARGPFPQEAGPGLPVGPPPRCPRAGLVPWPPWQGGRWHSLWGSV